MAISILNHEYFDLFLKVLIFSAAFAAIFLFLLQLFPNEQEIAARKRLGVAAKGSRPTRTPLFRWFFPVYEALARYLDHRSESVPALKRFMDEKRSPYQRKLITANLRDEITPEQLIALKFVTTFAIPLLGVAIAMAAMTDLSPLSAVLLLIGGYFLPDLLVWETIRRRRLEVIRALPTALDLLTLSVEAGLDFMAAIARLTERSKPNALIEEYSQMLREIRLGSSRADALRNMSYRLQIEEISSFTTLLIQTDQLGASIGQVLRAQSDQLRASRFQAAEAAGARASQLVMFPVVFCFFPAVFIIVLGPVALNFMAKGFLF